MNYKINTDKVREHLSDENKTISGIEKHLIQEGLKQILLGTGPVTVSTPGNDNCIRTVTPSMESFLNDLNIINKENNIEVKPEFLTWNFKGFSNNPNFFGTQRDWNQTLITRVNELYAKTMRKEDGPFNCIVTSPEIASIIEDLEYFHYAETKLKNIDIKNSVNPIGFLSGKYTVFVDYYIPANVLHCKKVENLSADDSSTWPKMSPQDLQISNTIKIINLQ